MAGSPFESGCGLDMSLTVVVWQWKVCFAVFTVGIVRRGFCVLVPTGVVGSTTGSGLVSQGSNPWWEACGNVPTSVGCGDVPAWLLRCWWRGCGCCPTTFISVYSFFAVAGAGFEPAASRL